MMLVITLVSIVLWVADLAISKVYFVTGCDMYVFTTESYIHIAFYFRKSARVNSPYTTNIYNSITYFIDTCIVKSVTLNVENCGQEITVNVVIFAGGKFCENVGKTFHVGILLLFPS